MGVLLIGDNVRVHQFILTSITDGTRVGGQRIRSLFTPFDARADIILYPCRARAAVKVRVSARKACANGRGRGLGGPPQERLPLHGRRGPTRPSILWLGRAALHAVKQCRLWVLGWRDADASLCSGLLAAMPRCLCRRLERNSAGRCHCCAPGCRRHRLSRGMW